MKRIDTLVQPIEKLKTEEFFLGRKREIHVSIVLMDNSNNDYDSFYAYRLTCDDIDQIKNPEDYTEYYFNSSLVKNELPFIIHNKFEKPNIFLMYNEDGTVIVDGEISMIDEDMSVNYAGVLFAHDQVEASKIANTLLKIINKVRDYFYDQIIKKQDDKNYKMPDSSTTTITANVTKTINGNEYNINIVEKIKNNHGIYPDLKLYELSYVERYYKFTNYYYSTNQQDLLVGIYTDSMDEYFRSIDKLKSEYVYNASGKCIENGITVLTGSSDFCQIYAHNNMEALNIFEAFKQVIKDIKFKEEEQNEHSN